MIKKCFKLNKDEEYITLGNLLKVCGIISTGGMALVYLTNNQVFVNGELESRRGKKLRPGDLIKGDKFEIEIQ